MPMRDAALGQRGASAPLVHRIARGHMAVKAAADEA